MARSASLKTSGQAHSQQCSTQSGQTHSRTTLHTALREAERSIFRIQLTPTFKAIRLRQTVRFEETEQALSLLEPILTELPQSSRTLSLRIRLQQEVELFHGITLSLSISQLTRLLVTKHRYMATTLGRLEKPLSLYLNLCIRQTTILLAT